MEKWYKRSHWRNLVDMHINDKIGDFLGQFDPEDYARNMKNAGMDCSELYTGNCLGICFFPTEVGHMHTGLHGRDIVGPTLDALKAQGIHRVAYFNMWSRWAFDTHPSWRLLDVNGRNSVELGFTGQSRYGVCCPNNEEFKAYIAKQIEYLCTHYEFDGMWIDMIGWFIAVCCCPSCREKYMRETGREIPRKMDWKDPDWLDFQRFRQRSSVEFMHVVDDTARRCKPGVTISYQNGSWLSGWFTAPSQELLDMSDYLGADIYGTPLTSSVVCKSMANLSRNKPWEYMTSRCVSLHHHTVNRSRDEMRLQVCGAVANNASFTTIDAISPDGRLDSRLYTMLGELKQEIQPYFRYWRPDAKLQHDVLLYMNTDSLFDPHSNDMRQPFSSENAMKIPAATLIGGHLTYDIGFKKNLPEMIRNSPAIILNNTYMLDEEEAALLRQYVEDGGSLIVTGLSGMYSMEGFRKDFALADVLGVHYIDETAERFAYIRPDEKYQYLMPEFNDRFPLSTEFNAVRIRADADTEVMGRLTLPWSTAEESTYFASAISNPPGVDTDIPAMTLHRYGKGKALYIAMPMQSETCSTIRSVFRSIVRFMLPDTPLISTNAPDWLELMLWDAGEFLQLTAYNAMDAYYVAAAPDVQIRVKLPKAPREVLDAKDEKKVPFQYENGVLSISAGTIESFAMFIIR